LSVSLYRQFRLVAALGMQNIGDDVLAARAWEWERLGYSLQLM